MVLSRRLGLPPLILFITVLLFSIQNAQSRFFGERLKRQNGANMYLSASSIVPGGEGDDPNEWSEWSSPSECSRSCGGGVSYQTRECLRTASNGAPICKGGNRKYFSCNTQDCPEDEPDFRAQQCSRFNHLAFDGIFYEWVPYTNAPNPCELNCMPKGERFYYRHKAKVIDGTRCNDQGLDVCVDGQCQPVGCDMMLGSDAKEDNCRKCGGDGRTCRTISDKFTTNNLAAGYNDILLVPSGATNIRIQETVPSNNYLSCRNLSSHYYLNGNWRIDFPRPMFFAGSWWNYQRKPTGFAAPDHLSCRGPITESIFVVMLVQDKNVSIEYEYSIPQSVSPSTPDVYTWTHMEYEPCSVSCGGGTQTRAVTCNNRFNLEEVDPSFCDEKAKPHESQACATEPCAPHWITSEWGKCSKGCGSDGIQNRTVTCERISPTGERTIEEDTVCLEEVGNKPANQQECNRDVENCPKYHLGPWSPCDKLCGEGKQRRKVTCYIEENGRKKVLSDADCIEQKPETNKTCMLTPCEGVDWILSQWSGCEECGQTVETRTAICASKSGKVYDDEFCAPETPLLSRPCESKKCKVQWFTSEWSKCSSSCGKGIQSRLVLCGEFDGKTITKVTDDAKCDAAMKPEAEQECEGEEKECPGEWFTGPWEPCSKICGGGERQREVLCLTNGTKADNCDETKISPLSEKCNTQACSEDEIMPVDSTDKSATDEEFEDDCEEYEEEEQDYIKLVTDKMSENLKISDGIDLDEESTLSSLITDDLMLSDSTPAAETTDEEISTDLPLSTVEGSGDQSESNDFSSLVTEGSGNEFESTSDSSFSTDQSQQTDFKTETSESFESSSSNAMIDSTLATVSTEPTDYTEISTDTSDSSSTDKLTTSESSATEKSTDSSIAVSEISESTDQSTESSSASQTTELSASIDTTESSSTTGSAFSTETSDVSTVSAEISLSTESYSESESTVSTFTTSISTDSTDTSQSISDSTESSASTDSTTELFTEPSSSTDSTTDISTESSISTSSEISSTAYTTSSTDSYSSTEILSSTEVSTSTETTYSTDDSTTSDDSPTSTESSLSTKFSSTSADSSASSEASSATDLSVSTDISTESSDTTQSWPSDKTEYSLSTVLSTSTNSFSDSTDTSTTSVTDLDLSTEAGNDSTDVTTESESAVSSISAETTDETFSTMESEYSEKTTSAFDTTTTEDDFSTSTSSDVFGSATDSSGDSAISTDEFTTIDIWTTEEEIEKSTPNTLEAAITKEAKPKKCKAKKPTTCQGTAYGCCPDGKNIAKGPFDKGCPIAKTCSETEFGCCHDGVSPASGNNFKGCPKSQCAETLFGCCPDKFTPAEGEDNEGCPEPTTLPPTSTTEVPEETTEIYKTENSGMSESTEASATSDMPETTESTLPEDIEKSCSFSEFGCCPDGKSAASGKNFAGCTDIVDPQNCRNSLFGCCNDGRTSATGPDNEGCPACTFESFGCCPDNETPAHGPLGEGCCLNSLYGCCPDNINSARGPNFEDCDCKYAPYGCCPDNKTSARGPNGEGCGCESSDFGCCPDKLTAAEGPKFQGCPCHTLQFGCCPDGTTIAQGPHHYGCHCSQTEFKCCPDEKTPAKGPENEGCTCLESKYGCCPDGVTSANGDKFEGCENVKEPPQLSCKLPKETGPCGNFSIKYFFDTSYGACAKFWYGGCDGNGNRFDTEGDCKETCQDFKGKEACLLPKSRGPCTGSITKWYFDAERGRCEEFKYGGCYGTNNRFDSLEECQSLCTVSESIPPCEQPMDQGPCEGSFGRWFYDNVTDVCRPFTYGGCKGNKNNYPTEHACNYHCRQPGVHKEPDITNEVLPNRCEAYESECNLLSCPYGIQKISVDEECHRCECNNPCKDHNCAEEQQCAIEVSSEISGQFVPVCRPINKPGICPQLRADDGVCGRECYTDADCRSDNKCCSNGCGFVCVRPTPPTIRTTAPTTVAPVVVYPGEVRASLVPKQKPELDVQTAMGGIAVLRCFATGNPAPNVTWSRNNVVVDTNQGRYVLTSSGDLTIVQVRQTDSGSYVCVASNGLGEPVRREIELHVTEPVNIPAYVYGDRNVTQVVTLNRPAVVRCPAGGHPAPMVHWWRNRSRLPLISQRFELARDYSLTFRSVQLSDLGPYTCEAWNRLSRRPASIKVTLVAVGPARATTNDDAQYLQYIIEPPQAPVTQRPSFPYRPTRPPAVPPPYVVPYLPAVPVSAVIGLDPNNQYNPGSTIAIGCSVQGYPKPNVTWTKDGLPLLPSERVQISVGEPHRLVIHNISTADSGRYGCKAANAVSYSISEESINVESTIPLNPECIDNEHFANCKLIVKGRYCKNKYYARFCCRSCALAGQL